MHFQLREEPIIEYFYSLLNYDTRYFYMFLNWIDSQEEPDKLFWHCARAYEDRLTLGFVIPDKSFWEMMIEDIRSE